MPTGAQPQPTPPADAQPFRCEISREHDSARIVMIGDLDLATAPLLQAGLDAVRDAGVRRLVLDLRRVGFMDSTGLRCILDCDAEARQDGFALALIPGSDVVQRVFELTNTRAHLRFVAP